MSLEKIFMIVMSGVCLKTIIGFRWTWEKCECCGKRFRDHPKCGWWIIGPKKKGH